MTDFFKFEADFVESLRCIPMQVRLKLDTCGIKLKLSHWHQFSLDDRTRLVTLPCITPTEIHTYRETLQHLVQQQTGCLALELPIDPNPAWMEVTVPLDVQHQAQALGVTISTKQWATLLPLERFALIKLSHSQHEHHNFLPALKEFGLA